MSRGVAGAYGDPIYRFHINQWLNRQPTTELCEHPDGLACVDLTHGWAVMLMAKRGAGPHINVLLADLEGALGMSRARILDGVEHGKTIMQMRFEMERDKNTKTSKE